MNQWILAALIGTLGMGCENRCEPGSARVLTGRVRNPSNPSVGEPIEILVQLGECAADRFPTPSVVGTGQSGEVQGRIVQTRLSSSPSKLDQEMSLQIEFQEVPSGWLDVALRFPASERVVRIYNASTIRNAVHRQTLNGRCRPPVRVSAFGTACTEMGSTGQSDVFEQAEGAPPVRLDAGSALWATPEGHLITTQEGIGWLTSETPIQNWRPAATLSNEVFDVAASSSVVFVLQPGVLRVFSKDLSTELPSVALANRTRGFVHFANGTLGILRPEGESMGTLEMLEPEATTWSSRGVRPINGSPVPGGAAGVWTCTPSLMTWNSVGASGLTPIAEIEAYGPCSGAAGSDRPFIVAARNTFVACPYLDGAAIRMVEVSAPSGSGRCYGALAMLNYGADADAWTEMFDIGASLP